MSTTIHRLKNRTQKQFVILDKASLWDKNLSLKAVGLWARLLSRPDDWDFHVKELAKSCDVSEKNIYKILKELIVNGYVKRERIVDPVTKRVVRWELSVFESSQVVEEKSQMDKSDLVDSGHITNIEITNPSSSSHTYVCSEEDPPIYSPKKRVKIKEEKKEVAKDVWLTPRQLEDLQDRIKGDPRITLPMLFQRLSKWKIGKSLTGGNDYRCIINWVIRAVIEDQDKPRNPGKVETTQYKDNKLIAEKVEAYHPGHTDIEVMGNSIVFFYPNEEVAYITFSDHGFREQVVNNLRRKNLSTMGF